MKPFLTVIVPTIGRHTLRKTLESLALQPQAGELEVIVVQDIHNRAYLPLDVSLGARAFHSIIYCEYDGGINAWGHPQRNYAMQFAAGEWVATLDDDDVWRPDALDTIIRGVSGSDYSFHIFKMQHVWSRVVIWNRRTPSQGNVGTPMMVWRNGSLVGQWGNVYEGDYVFCKSTMLALPNGMDDLYWQDAIIADIRPETGIAV